MLAEIEQIRSGGSAIGSSAARSGRRLPRWGAGAVWALLAPVVVSCAGAAEERDPAPVPELAPVPEWVASECVAQEGELAQRATLAAGAGSYRLTLVADGEEGRRTVAGTLDLVANTAPLRRIEGAGDAVTVPLYGWAAIDLAAVDALEIGDVGSRDPLRPGVLVLEQQADGTAPAAITLRFGSIANRRDGPTAFDGGYLALHVGRVNDSGGFTGSWASGVHARRVEGFFCAVPGQ